MAERLDPEASRQGERGKPVLWVLVVSLVLLAIATVGLLTWNGGNAPKDYASQSQDAARRTATGQPGGAAPASTPSDNPASSQPARKDANR